MVGGADMLRFRSGGAVPEAKLGNTDFLLPVNSAGAIPLHIQSVITAPNVTISACAKFEMPVVP